MKLSHKTVFSILFHSTSAARVLLRPLDGFSPGDFLNYNIRLHLGKELNLKILKNTSGFAVKLWDLYIPITLSFQSLK